MDRPSRAVHPAASPTHHHGGHGHRKARRPARLVPVAATRQTPLERPGRARGRELIPELEALGKRFAAETIEDRGDQELAAAIGERAAAVETWRQTYLEDFIPFAHGVRQLGIYYNDAVQPDDPYEFVRLLQGQQMVASRRNSSLRALAQQVASNQALL